MNTHFVIFDGTSYYVVDKQDMLAITKDKDAKVVFRSMNLDLASDKADELNSDLY